MFLARWAPCLPAAERPKQQDRPASARDTAAGLSNAVHLHSFRTQSTSRKAGTKSTHFCVSPLRTELSKHVRMPGKDRSKRAIRLLEQADRCLEALSQILPLPTMTGRGIVVLYDLFDRIEQFPGILKKRQVFGHTTGHSIPFNRPIKRYLRNGIIIYEGERSQRHLRCSSAIQGAVIGQRMFAHCLLSRRL